MRNRQIKSIALFSGSFFLLLLLVVSSSLYAHSGGNIASRNRVLPGGPRAEERRHPAAREAKSPANVCFNQHFRKYGKAGHSDKYHLETDLFAGANKAGVPAASQALASD